MLHLINNSLNQKTSEFRNLLIDFKDSSKLDNQETNPFYEYLKYVDFNLFSLGEKKVLIRFENNTFKQNSKVKIFQLVPTRENGTGVREKELDIDMTIGVGGDFNLRGKVYPPHLIGLTFFSEIENTLNQ